MSHTKFAMGLVVLLVAAIAATLWYQSAPDLDEARKLLGRGDNEAAREVLEDYVSFYPEDYEALAMLAESMINDPQYNSTVRGAKEIDAVLEKIPDSAAQATKARLQQASLALNVLHEIQKAERMTKRALKIDPNHGEANRTMWIILQLTRRFAHAEKYYDRAYEAANDTERVGILQNWYLSQFRPFTLSVGYDRGLDIKPGPNSEAQRYGSFLKMEPNAAAPRAAGAALFLEAGQVDEALKLLDDESVEPYDMDASFLGMLVEALITVGRPEEAAEALDEWAGETESYLYHRAAAMVAEEVEEDYDKALTHYEAAMAQWPATVDARTRSQYASCLRKAKQPEKAAEQEKIVEESTRFTDQKIHGQLHLAMRSLPDPEAVKKFADFYRLLGREQDAKRWEAVLTANLKPGQPGQAPAKSTPTERENAGF